MTGCAVSRSLGLPGRQFLPTAASARKIGVGAFQEYLQGCAARETIELVVVRIDPIQRAVRLDSRARRDADGIEAVEFTAHGHRRHDRLPDAAAMRRDGA